MSHILSAEAHRELAKYNYMERICTEKLRNDITNLKNDINDLNMKILDKDKAYAEKNEILGNQIVAQKDIISKLEFACSEKDKVIEDREGQIKDYVVKWNQQQDEIHIFHNVYRADIARLNSIIGGHVNNISKMTDNIHSLQATNKENEVKNRDLEILNQRKSDALVDLRNSNKKGLEHAIGEYQKKCRDYESRIDNLRVMNETCGNTIQEYISNKKDMETKICEYEKSLDKEKTTNQGLVIEISKLKEDMFNLGLTNIRLVEKIQKDPIVRDEPCFSCFSDKEMVASIIELFKKDPTQADHNTSIRLMHIYNDCMSRIKKCDRKCFDML